MRCLNTLIVLDDVFVLEEFNHFDFIVEEFTKELFGNVIFRNDFDGDHSFMILRVRKLRMSRTN